MEPTDQLVRRLLKLSCGTSISKVDAYLEMAAEIVGEDCIALLWVYDSAKGRYLLANYNKSKTLIASSEDIRAIHVEKVEPISDFTTLSTGGAPGLAKLILPHQLILEASLFPTEIKDENGVKPHVGYLHVLSRSAFTDVQTDQLNYVAQALASAVKRWRHRRIRVALQQLQEDLSKQNSSEDWLQRSAKLLRSITEASLCIAFQASLDHTIKAIAVSPKPTDSRFSIGTLIGSPKSVLRRCLEKPCAVRIADFQSSGERELITGTSEFDENLENQISKIIGSPVKSLLIAPIVSDQHVIAIIALFNKCDYLPEQFTETDLKILTSVCDFLSGVMPSVEMTRTMEHLSEVFNNVNLDDERQRAELYLALSQTIPSVSGAVLGLKKWGSNRFESTLIGGELTLFQKETFAPSKHVEILNDNNSHRYCVDIQGLDKEVRLSLALSEKHLSRNELRALKFFVAQLGQKLRADEIIETEIRRLVETRHAVRSGLNGLGHLEEALTCFAVIARDNYQSPEVMLKRAHRSIKRAALFAKKTRTLMEESRFLLSEITPQSLRKKEYSISQLVHEVNLCLAPEAEQKCVTVDIDNQIPNILDKVHNDPLLTDIVVFNLIDNAIKYSASGKHVQIKLTVKGGDWCMWVTNEGPWISDRDKPAIFLPFERRVKGKWAESTIGTGIGLAVARKIIHAHNGQIDATSNPLSDKSSYPAKTVFFVSMPRR